MKRVLVALTLVVVAMSASWLFFVRNKAEAPTSSSNQEQAPTPEEPTEQTTGFDKTKYSTSEPASPWWVVNKKRALPNGYVPSDLTVPNVRLRLAKTHEQMKFSKQAVPAVEEMFKAAQTDGVTLVFGSGYRSYNLQKQFYNSYVSQDGQTAADRYSARPGTSEHQTGLAFDATSVSGKCHLEICFADMSEGKWLKDHAQEHGFIIRYLDGKESVTGYQYEPWHMRYVGKELAAEMHKIGPVTLEEFFGLPAAATY